jgi:hypothetical protein
VRERRMENAAYPFSFPQRAAPLPIDSSAGEALLVRFMSGVQAGPAAMGMGARHSGMRARRNRDA